MNAILLAAAGIVEGAGWDRFVVRFEEVSFMVLSGLQVEDNGVKQGRPNSTSITVFAVKCGV